MGWRWVRSGWLCVTRGSGCRDNSRRGGARQGCHVKRRGAPARAAEIEPRAYLNTPVGMNFVIAGYVYSEGGLSTDPASPLQDASMRISTGLFAYARSLDIFGMSGKIDVVAPYSDLSGSATFKGEPVERHVSGLNDPLLGREHSRDLADEKTENDRTHVFR